MASSLSLEIDRLTEKIQWAILDAVENDLKDGLLRKIEESAEKNVYSYAASPKAMATRRGTIGSAEVMTTEAGGGGLEFYLRITNNAYTQHPANDDEADIVEEGNTDYRQPYPRPFMQKALDEFIGSGEAEAILQEVLERHGL